MYFYKRVFVILIIMFMLCSVSGQEFDIDMHSGVPFSMNYELPKSFIFSTAAPHYFYTIPMPPDCLKEGEVYGDVLTGYENYFPCASINDDVHSISYIELGDSKGVFPKHVMTVPQLRVFTSKNMSGLNFDYVVAQNFIDFAKHYRGLQRLSLVNHKVDSLEGLEELEHLKYLDLSVSYVEDWSSIEKLPHVETLNLACSNIRNQDLEHIAKLTTVKTLVLDGTEISDVSALRDMQNLQNLLLKVTNITDFEQLEVLQPLQLRWISFDPTLSKKAVLEAFPHLEPTHFINTHTIKLSIGRFIDTQYPAKNCREIIYSLIRVW